MDPVGRTAAQQVVDLAGSRPPTLGPGRLVCLDGPAGSGKTSLADSLVSELRARAVGVRVVHLDDLYAGWKGLHAVVGQLATLLEPLARGLPGRYRRWDWHASAYVEEVVVDPVDLLVLEGVGSFDASYATLVTALVWVDAPLDVRTARVLARDGDDSAPYLSAWQADEAAHHAAHRTRERADLTLG